MAILGFVVMLLADAYSMAELACMHGAEVERRAACTSSAVQNRIWHIMRWMAMIPEKELLSCTSSEARSRPKAYL